MGFGIAVAPGPKGTAAAEHDFGKEQVHHGGAVQVAVSAAATQEVQKDDEFADEILEVPVYKEKKAAEEKAVKDETAEAEAEASDVKAAKEEFTEAAEKEAVKVKERATKAKAFDEKAAKDKIADAEAKASADKVASEECTDTEAAEEEIAVGAVTVKAGHIHKEKKAAEEKAVKEKIAEAEAEASDVKAAKEKFTVANERFTDSARVVAVRNSVLAKISEIEKQLESSSTSRARGLHLEHFQYLRDRLDHVLEEDEFSAAEADDGDAAVAAEFADLLAEEHAESSDGIVGAFPQLPETRHGVELLLP